MQTIDIRTTQNVIINYELAPLRDRFIGLFIDVLIVFVVYLVIAFVGGLSGTYGSVFAAILPYLMLIFFFTYTLGMEIFQHGQSFGKMATGVKVVKLDGTQPSLSDFVIRAVFHFIDTALCIGVLGAIFIATSEHRQRMGDRAANTVVVKLNASSIFNLNDILNISTIENYEPIYPEIKNISEGDMLLVKNAILRHRNNPSDNNIKVLNKLSLKMSQILDVRDRPSNNVEFLKTLIKDYIVLTR